MKKLLYLTTFLMLFLVVACDSDPIEDKDKDKEPPSAKDNLSGEWVVSATLGEGDYTYGPFNISTQTMNDKKTLTIKDEGNFWNFQVKADANLSENSFSTSESLNEISKVGAKIKVLSGTVVDAKNISFSIQFEDDETPYGFTYKIVGERK